MSTSEMPSLGPRDRSGVWGWPRAIIVMGVSGAGKSTLGRGIADHLGDRFIEGDDLHPPANVAKMAAGIPLDDADRWPWLERIATALAEAAGQGGGVVSCSALRRRYRDFIVTRSGLEPLFVHPVLDQATLRDRLAAREGHYMPVSLLDSQLAVLEPPEPDEWTITVPGDLPVDRQIAMIEERLGGIQSQTSIQAPTDGAPGRT